MYSLGLVYIYLDTYIYIYMSGLFFNVIQNHIDGMIVRIIMSVLYTNTVVWRNAFW